MKHFIFLIAFAHFLPVLTNAQTNSEVPVRISSFDATSGNSSTTLFWKTACSLEYANFEIQRSYDGANYSTINTFSANWFRCQQPFDFSDSTVNQLAGRVYYRLKVGDLEGRVYNSKIIAVFTKGKGVEINSFAPAPVNSSSSLSISASENLNGTISIINELGTSVYMKSVRINKGVNTVELNLGMLQSGKYWLILSNTKYENQTLQFLKL